MAQGGAPVERARDEFLHGGAVSSGTAVRQQILASWRRSQIAGVDADRFDVPYEPDLDFEGSLVSCARPLLDRMEEQLSGMAACVVLTDPAARVLDRRVGEHHLAHKLDEICFAPGFSYAEVHAGTNGVGTALEGGAATFVVGAEHFHDRLQYFACAGAPIRNPFTRRLEGLIDITCLQADANAMMRVLAVQAARDVEQLLLERGTAGPHAVLAEFRMVSARSRNAVLAVSGDVVMANTAAGVRLTPTDHEQLRQHAIDLSAHRAPGEVRLLLSGGEARVRYVPVWSGPRPAGVVMEVAFARSAAVSSGVAQTTPDSPRSLVGLVGSSPAWVSTCAALRRAARRRENTLVLGEAGVGKYASVHGAHVELRSRERFGVVDCGQGAEAVREALMDALADAGATVVLRHLQRADPVEVAAIRAVLRDVQPGNRWLVGTLAGATVDGGSPLDELLELFHVSITVPPLRHRADDIEAMITALLGRLARGRRARCSAEACRLLVGGRWPGNVAELESVLRRALERRPVGEIGLDDLPVEFVAGSSRRRLSKLETAERDLIVKALMEANGNRVKAAAALGIGRATLYRRMSAFGVEFVGKQP